MIQSKNIIPQGFQVYGDIHQPAPYPPARHPQKKQTKTLTNKKLPESAVLSIIINIPRSFEVYGDIHPLPTDPPFPPQEQTTPYIYERVHESVSLMIRSQTLLYIFTAASRFIQDSRGHSLAGTL